MIYAIIIVGSLLAGLLILVWFRKVQFDAVHRNFLDLEDAYPGKVIRSGFAVRPSFKGALGENHLSVSLSAEKKEKNVPRQYYISIFLKQACASNFTILSTEWIKDRKPNADKKLFNHEICSGKYVIEVKDAKILKQLDIPAIEKITKKIAPIAYALVSKNGILAERISTNLISDTEFNKLNPLITGLNDLGLHK